jgi:quinohemoprotein ethanol dehydrogenase
VIPSDAGAHNWYPISFSPTTGFVYFSVLDDAPLFHVVDSTFVLKVTDQTLGRDTRYQGPLLARMAAAKPQGRLVAWDPVRGREAWRAEFPVSRSGGTLSTAGNLVFQGRGDGKFAAYRALDGKRLWEFDVGVGIAAAPMTYAVDGVQYVAVEAEPPRLYMDDRIKTGPGRLLVFSLGGRARLPPDRHVETPIPPPTFTVPATPADLREGESLFNRYCRRCHFPGANGVKSGAVPDLRRSTAATHAAFDSVVRGGARRTLGMPSFKDDLSAEQVRWIEAYVLAWAGQAAVAKPTAGH